MMFILIFFVLLMYFVFFLFIDDVPGLNVFCFVYLMIDRARYGVKMAANNAEQARLASIECVIGVE